LLSFLYFDYFSVSSIISACFTLLTAAFLLIVIRKKSRASWILGFAFLLLTMGNLAYSFATSLYSEYTAYHRWFAIFFVVQALGLFAFFFFQYPERRFPRLDRVVLVLNVTFVTILTALFVQKTWNINKFFRYDAHYWDFEEYEFSRKVALGIFALLLTSVLAAVLQIIKSKGRERLAVGGMFALFLFATIVPASANSLAHQGIIERGLYQLLYNLFTVIGFSFLLIIYINNSSDSSTFLAKIIGVCVIVFLLLIQGISYFSFQELERGYDQVHRRDARLAAREGETPSDMKYLADVTPGAGEVMRGSDPGLDHYREEITSAYVYEAYRSGRVSPAVEKMTTLPENAFLFPFTSALRGANETIRDEELAKANKTIRALAEKIRAYPPDHIRENVSELLSSNPALPDDFKKTVNFSLASSPSIPGREMKKAVLRFFVPMLPATQRRFRQDELGNHYLAFLYYDSATSRMFEAGFDYRVYRQGMHGPSLLQLALLGAVLATVLGGFRFFFMGILITPLEHLQQGLRRVNRGDLTIHLTVRSEDEIGFLSRSFNTMVDSIREGRDRLEEKVRERTADLKKSLDEVQALKTQQDGDYFLTARLIKPLGSNFAKSENINIEFYIKQKKNFHFRTWEDEIGGDLCMSDTIFLQERKFVVFMNADAMGKSMQGAGGALVLGSVLRAIIERTKLSSTVKTQPPERWLKNAFLELQKVFESFDGLMLVSSMFGLVDDEAGLVYYMNAEHPRAVIYRDGTAEYIEESSIFRKLGTQVDEGLLTISIYQMRPGDVLILGTDGRDDLMISLPDGSAAIDQDESSFLRKVVDGEGSLAGIAKAISVAGDLTDDLALLRISFQEGKQAERKLHPEALRLLRNGREEIRCGNYESASAMLRSALDFDVSNPDIWKAVSRVAFHRGEYREAGDAAMAVLRINPSDSATLYAASYCLRKIRNFTAAAELGERLRLREPTHLRNLRNLAASYFSSGNLLRAREIAEDILKLDKTDRIARQVLEEKN